MSKKRKRTTADSDDAEFNGQDKADSEPKASRGPKRTKLSSEEPKTPLSPTRTTIIVSDSLGEILGSSVSSNGSLLQELLKPSPADQEPDSYDRIAPIYTTKPTISLILPSHSQKTPRNSFETFPAHPRPQSLTFTSPDACRLDLTRVHTEAIPSSALEATGSDIIVATGSADGSADPGATARGKGSGGFQRLLTEPLTDISIANPPAASTAALCASPPSGRRSVSEPSFPSNRAFFRKTATTPMNKPKFSKVFGQANMRTGAFEHSGPKFKPILPASSAAKPAPATSSTNNENAPINLSTPPTIDLTDTPSQSPKKAGLLVAATPPSSHSSASPIAILSSPPLHKPSMLPKTIIADQPVLDWSIKDYVRFYSSKPFSTATSLFATGPAESRYLSYYVHPSNKVPTSILSMCMKCSEKLNRELTTTEKGLREFWAQRTLDWVKSIDSIFGLLLDRRLPCFYVMFERFTVLVTAANIAASKKPRAIINKTTESVRNRLTKANITFEQPFQKPTTQTEAQVCVDWDIAPTPVFLDNYPASVVVIYGDSEIRKLVNVIFDMVDLLELSQEAREAEEESDEKSSNDGPLASLSLISDEIPATIPQRQILSQAMPSPQALMSFIDDLPMVMSPVCPFLHSTLRRLDTKLGSMKVFNESALEDVYFLDITGPITPAFLLPVLRILAAEHKEFTSVLQTSARTCWLNVPGESKFQLDDTVYSTEDERTIRLQQTTKLGLNVLSKIVYRRQKYESTNVYL